MSRINDGFPTRVDIFTDDDMGTPVAVLWWEKTVKPPGFAGGGPNRTSTMRNTRYHTNRPKQLLTLKSMSLKVAYDTSFVETIASIMQVNVFFLITWPDGSTYGFYGWVDDFDFDDVEEGAQPEATITIEPSNETNDDPAEEFAPVYTPAT